MSIVTNKYKVLILIIDSQFNSTVEADLMHNYSCVQVGVHVIIELFEYII